MRIESLGARREQLRPATLEMGYLHDPSWILSLCRIPRTKKISGHQNIDGSHTLESGHEMELLLKVESGKAMAENDIFGFLGRVVVFVVKEAAILTEGGE